MFEAQFVVSTKQRMNATETEVDLLPHPCSTQGCADFPFPIVSGRLTLLVPHMEAAAKFEIGKSVSVQLKITF